MICSGDKMKLLIVGTHENRRSKLEMNNLKLKINICEQDIEETKSVQKLQRAKEIS